MGYPDAYKRKAEEFIMEGNPQVAGISKEDAHNWLANRFAEELDDDWLVWLWVDGEED